MKMEPTSLASLIGIFVFTTLMVIAYRFADGKWKVAENKKDDYLNWINTSGRKVKRSILIISVIYGLFMLIQLSTMI